MMSTLLPLLGTGQQIPAASITNVLDTLHSVARIVWHEAHEDEEARAGLQRVCHSLQLLQPSRVCEATWVSYAAATP